MTVVDRPATGRRPAPGPSAPAPEPEPGRVRRALARGRAGREAVTDYVQSFLDRPLTVYYLLIGATALLLLMGLIMVFSASSVMAFEEEGDSFHYVKKQATWMAIGIPGAFLASRMRIADIRRFAFPGFLLSLGLLGAVVKFGISTGGNKNWLALGPVTIQPAEIAKLAIVLWAAHIFAYKERRLRSVKQMLIPVVPGLMLVIGLVLAGRDLGTALVLGAILLAMLWVVGVPFRVFGLALSGLAVGAFYMAATSAHRLARLTTFVDPFADYLRTGWQPAHGFYALATGGVFGQGIGASTQKWGGLGEAHTDFIFAVIGEELGLVGTLLVLVLFLTLAYAGIRVAQDTDQAFVRYFAFGVVAWLMSQMVINVGMVLGLLPVIGIPLPLISYGGSALLPSLAAVGLLIGCARRQPEAAAALASRRKGRSRGISAGRLPGASRPRG